MIFLRPFGRHLFALSSPSYSKILRHVGRTTPGMRWEDGERAWVGYADAVEVAVARAKAHGEKVKGEELIPNPDVGEDEILLARPAFRDLYPYQRDALRFLIATAQSGVILGLDVGLGKTLTALRHARSTKDLTVVVAPAFASNVWERETEKWWPEAAPAFVLKGTKLMSPKQRNVVLRLTQTAAKAEGRLENEITAEPLPRIIIANYAIIHAWVPTLIAAGYRNLILDEGHMIQGPKARRTVSLYELRAACTTAMALTGTPIPNFTRNLWLLSDLLSPGRFGKFFDFGLRYCGGKQVQVDPIRLPDKVVWDFDGSSNQEELHNRLRHFMFRRTKAEVASELPALTRQLIEFDVTSKAPKRKGLNPYASLVRADGRTVDKAALRGMLGAAADRKIPQVVDLIVSHVEAGQRVIVYTYRRAVAETIVELLQTHGIVEAAYLHGGMTPEKRQKELARLRDHVRVLAVTIDSMGVAVDLTFASVGVVAELTYEPHEIQQLEGRQNRRGQTEPVLMIYTIARGSVDELIKETVLAKLATQQQILKEKDAGLKQGLTSKTSEQILSALAERILKGG